jgi:hypothetical protein
MWNALKIKGAEKALDMGLALTPPLLNQLMGKAVVPTTDSSEAYVIRNFFKGKDEGGSMTPEQAEKVIGKFENGKRLAKGILTLEQIKLFVDIAECRVPVDKLDDLMPDGPYAITKEQVLALAEVIPVEQLAPIHLMFEARQKRRAAAMAAKEN